MTTTILLADRSALDRLEIEGGWRRSFVGRFWGTLRETADDTPIGDGSGLDDLLRDHRLVCIDESLLAPVEVDAVDRLALERLRNNFIEKVAAYPHVRLVVIDGDGDAQVRQLSELDGRIREVERACRHRPVVSKVVLVFCQPMAPGSRSLLDGFRKSHDAISGWYLMGDRLQPETEGGRLAASFAVWPLAVARLLAVIAHRSPPDGARGRVHAWRTILWGGADTESWDAQFRTELRSRLLPTTDAEPQSVVDARDISIPEPSGLVTEAPQLACKPFAWEDDPEEFRNRAFESIEERVFIDAMQESGQVSSKARALQWGITCDGVVRGASEAHWSEVRTHGPKVLRRLKDGRYWKPHDMNEEHERQRSSWAELVRTRRQLAAASEHHRDASEEVGIARARHLSLWWRLGIAAAIMILVGQLIASILLPLRTPGGPTLPTPGNAFMGVPLEGDSIGYLVDRSGSMAGERIARLRAELERSVLGLGDGLPFCVIAYSTEHAVMAGGAGGLVPANPEACRKAVDWVNSLEADGGTRPVEGLRAALAMKPQTLVFLTDGQFSPEDKEKVRALLAGIDPKKPSTRIHTIAMYQRTEEPFLKAVAEGTGGQYRFIAWDPFEPFGFELVASLILAATALGVGIGAFLPWHLERRAGCRGTAVLRGSMGGLLKEFAQVTSDTQKLMANALRVRCFEAKNAEAGLQRALAARAYGTVEHVLLGGGRAAPEEPRTRDRRGGRLASEDRSDFRRILDVPALDPNDSSDDGRETRGEPAKSDEIVDPTVMTILGRWEEFCRDHDLASTGHLPAWAIRRRLGQFIDEAVDRSIEARLNSDGGRAKGLPDRLRRSVELGTSTPFLSVRVRLAPETGCWPKAMCCVLHRRLAEEGAIRAEVDKVLQELRRSPHQISTQIEVEDLGFHALGLVHQEFAIDLLPDGDDGAGADAQVGVR